MKGKSGFALMGVIAISVATAAFAQDTGAATYKAKCAMCHAADGSGNTPAGKSMKTLPFNSPDLLKASDVDLVAATGGHS
jgi:mono/diheme cytochrome c family protein